MRGVARRKAQHPMAPHPLSGHGLWLADTEMPAQFATVDMGSAFVDRSR